ncbi:MAG TPA: hypothetical protein VFO86_08000 [Terriglobia bacterium]|nr:hypothetical protein [Terriglobia bacterium]
MRTPRLSTIALVMLGTAMATIPLAAQWVNYPTADVPRKADGKVDMAAKTPRLADGKPDFSGVWTSDEIDPRKPNEPPNPKDATTSRRMINLGVELPGGLPYQPWLAALVKERTANHAIDDPHVKCFPDNFLRAYGTPHLLKFVHTPKLMLVLNEWNAGFRQIFTDARPLPIDPTPSWQGFSTAKWSGDTLIVDTIGVRDDSWVDWNGSVITESAKVREQFQRPDLGHLVVQVTVDDPKAYTKPWTVTIKERLIVDTELIEEICLEGEKDLQHLK